MLGEASSGSQMVGYSYRLAHSVDRGAEEDRLGDGDEDRENPRYRSPRGHERQVEGVMETLSEGPEDFYKIPY
jgi:hypothetical protein